MLSRLLLMLFFLFPAAAYGAKSTDGEILDYNLAVSFDISSSQIIGHARIGVKKGQELKLHRENLHILDLYANRQKMETAGWVDPLKLKPSEDGYIEIRYVATFKSREHPGGVAPPPSPRIPTRVIDQRGIFLTGLWYPKPERMCRYHLTATLPSGYEAISEAETIETARQAEQRAFSFSFPHPLNSLTLIATDRYRITRERFNETEILAYFFPEDEKLVPAYLDHTKKYLKLYETLIGKYPYRRFSIVENFLPTGFSMPTYTVLGQEVVRLPFIVKTSLGHEILHQWFGNFVYVDYAGGNWAEGLTTDLADHLYEEQNGRGCEYRKGALIDYQSYVTDKNEFPLKDFRERTGRSSQAIGYGKAFLVFHMLRNLLGRGPFLDSLKYFSREMCFQKAGWEDLKRAFEKISQRDLQWFFHQWVDGKGLADPALEEGVKVTPVNGEFEVQFTVAQRGRVFRFDLPVSFYSPLGKVTHTFSVNKERNDLKVLLPDWPRTLVIDENYDLARTLSPEEFPPVIARLIGEDPSVIVLPREGEKPYQAILEYFKGRGARVERAEGGKYEEASSLVILGDENPQAEKLYGRVGRKAGFGLTVRANPWNPKKVIGIFQGKSKEEVDAAFTKIFYYGKYSAVAFDQGRNVYKMTEPTSRGMVRELVKPTAAVEISTLKDLAEVIRQVEDRKIVYAGETHDLFSHHIVQLEVIKALHRQGKKVAIGMEMFQSPFQGAVDDYIAGRIGEREFLKKTEYFKRWRFDYNLYRPILQFARGEKIPVAALNIRTEIVEKVARHGLDSLSEEERKFIPRQMDFSDEAYRDRLREIFREHKDFPGRNFDFFYQAQILWDESMAESIDSFLKTNPDHQMVVLAGAGHLAFGSGIPRRTARRNGLKYAILLNDAELARDVADYVVYPGAMAMEGSPKLMVFLGEEKGQVVIQGFSAGSVSEKAGLQKGDIILSLDQNAVHQIDDVRLDLLFKKRGTPVKVKIRRNGPEDGGKEMEFEVTPR
jgi:aminopeptidase N